MRRAAKNYPEQKKMLGKRGITARKNAADRLEVIKRPMSVIKRRS